MASGRIDIHSHLIPGVDDGCADVGESLACVKRLMGAGYVGSVCTPHVWPAAYPWNTPRRVAEEVAELREVLAGMGLAYEVWTGAEVRLDEHAVARMEREGVPALGESRSVLVDFWADRWPGYVDEALAWLQGEGYRVVLAHPERIGIRDDERWLSELETRWVERGGLLQGNLRPLVGGDGKTARRRGEALLRAGRYAVLALDMHRPDTLEERLGGLAAAAKIVGEAEVDRLTGEAVRGLLGVGG